MLVVLSLVLTGLVLAPRLVPHRASTLGSKVSWIAALVAVVVVPPLLLAVVAEPLHPIYEESQFFILRPLKLLLCNRNLGRESKSICFRVSSRRGLSTAVHESHGVRIFLMTLVLGPELNINLGRFQL